MSKRFIKLLLLCIFAVAAAMVSERTNAQSNPTPAPLNRPDYDYTESNGCTRCHFSRGPLGAHMLEAVGVKFDSGANAFAFTGSGWRASEHAATNYKSTQNTYCAKCHSPLQAKPEAAFKNGTFFNTEPVLDSKVEGVTCAACHPTHNAAVVLGRRLGIYKFGMDKATAEAYEPVHHGEEDLLCLNCHIERHDEANPAFKSMYDAGVRCIDCHMAPYGFINDTHIEKRFHDFKVAKNLPFSCGVDGAIVSCHPGFSAQGTLNFLPMLKQQHVDWWPMKPGKKKKLITSADYLAVWQEMQATVSAQGK